MYQSINCAKNASDIRFLWHYFLNNKNNKLIKMTAWFLQLSHSMCTLTLKFTFLSHYALLSSFTHLLCLHFSLAVDTYLILISSSCEVKGCEVRVCARMCVCVCVCKGKQEEIQGGSIIHDPSLPCFSAQFYKSACEHWPSAATASLIKEYLLSI